MTPFTGELMRCCMCGREEQSDPTAQSDWRAIEIDGAVYYACPNEFPPNGSDRHAYEKAYLKIFDRIEVLMGSPLSGPVVRGARRPY